MEAKKEIELDYLGKFDGLSEAASVLQNTGKDTFAAPAWRFCCNSSGTIQPEESKDADGVTNKQNMQIFDKRTDLLCGKTMCKTESWSAHFIVNIDDLVKNVNGSFDETGFILNRASKDDLGYSVSRASRDPLPPENLSDIRILPTSSCGDSERGQCPPTCKEDPAFAKWKKIQVEPTLPITLKFQDVKYKVVAKGVENSDIEKYILHGITGSVHPGEVLALMGPSGGGKTTLLNLLSGRVKSNSGTITYNDQPYANSLKRRIGFVTQDDVVFPHLTVKETITYAALLCLPNILTRQQKKERAMNLICQLGLESCQDIVIGGKLVRGISGGERKRVCIGNEILLNPSLLFLDEPTSGLDSTTAIRIVQILKGIAEVGKTVVTTIHQPSSRLFSMFDKLILLGKGSSLYFGKASEAMLYFSSLGCYPLTAMSPAEFLIDLANGNINDKTVPSELEDNSLPGSKGPETRNGCPSPANVHEYLVEAYEARAAKMEKTKLLKTVVVEGKAEMQGKLTSSEWEATWWEEFSILFKRGLKERSHEYFSFVRVTQVIATAIIVGLLWWHSDASSPKKLQDQAGLLFFISVFWSFFPLFSAIFTFPQERAMLIKERSVGMYRLSAYFAARNISDLPLDLILPIVFLVIVYFMVGLKLSCSAFSLTILTVFLCIVAAQGLGLTMGAAFMDVKKATTLASITIMTFMLSGGFFLQKVPSFMSWVRYISFNYHTYRLLLKIQCTCSDSASGSVSCQSPFIRELRLDWGGTEVGALMVMIIAYRLLAYSFLRTMKLTQTT